ncbi:MFS transporter [Pseudonocardia sp. GCM10023141]|uniref:MFS transporter n=1 Tax=Pseudonocardia sp. GCM10023141 TaxID=3252653 RepID=UPI00361EC9A6
MRLLAAPGMAAYYVAATLARVGDEMVGFALVLLVLDRTGSPLFAGAAGAAYALPAIATGPLLGAWLDRTAYRRTALGVNQAVLGLTMLGMLAVVGRAPDAIALLLAAVAGLTLPMVSGGFTSMLPSLVPAPLLTRANAAEAASFSAATMAGPAAAATVAALFSPAAAVGLIVVTAASSILALVAVPVVAPVVAGDGPSMLAAALDGLRHLVRVPPLRSATVASTLSLGANGLLLVALPLHMGTLGAPRAAGGYVWTAIEVGSVATALLVGRRQERWRPERTVVLSVAAFGVGVATWPLAGSLGALIALAFLAGLLEGPMMPALFGARQQYSPLALQGRVSTTAASLRMGALAVGQAAGGLLVPHTGTAAVLLIVGGTQVGAALLGLLAVRSRQAVPGAGAMASASWGRGMSSEAPSATASTTSPASTPP